MGEWVFLTCLHGRTEGLDSHECSKCQKMAADIGLPVLHTGYLFTEEITEAEKLRLQEHYGVKHAK